MLVAALATAGARWLQMHRSMLSSLLMLSGAYQFLAASVTRQTSLKLCQRFLLPEWKKDCGRMKEDETLKTHCDRHSSYKMQDLASSNFEEVKSEKFPFSKQFDNNKSNMFHPIALFRVHPKLRLNSIVA